jgi:hypothetical protein
MNSENKRDTFAIISKIKLRYHYDPFLDLIDSNPKNNTLLKQETEVIANIQRTPLDDLISYNVVLRNFPLCRVQRQPEYKRFIKHIFKRLEYLQSSEKLPYIMCEDSLSKNPLEIAIQNSTSLIA